MNELCAKEAFLNCLRTLGIASHLMKTMNIQKIKWKNYHKFHKAVRSMN